MGLEGNDHVILRAGLGGVFEAAHFHRAALTIADQRQSILVHGGEMGTARDQGHVFACRREFRAEKSADGTGAVNANLHG